LARYCLLNALRRISAAFLAVPFNTPARDAIRDPTIAAIGDPRALPELLVHRYSSRHRGVSGTPLQSDPAKVSWPR